MRVKSWVATVKAAVWAVVLASAGSAAFGQGRPGGRSFDPSSFGTQIASTLVFGFVGIVMTIVGFKMFDALIRFNLAEEICEKQNVAAAILCGAMLVAIGIIIAVAVY